MSGSPLINGVSTEALGAITTPELDLSQGITSLKSAAYHRRAHGIKVAGSAAPLIVSTCE